ncbi:MAG: two-partner secretion domain-containing protein, partial [Gammaproteobacteria bacterium]
MNKRPNKAVTPNAGGAPGLGGPIRMKPLAAHVRRALFPGLIMGLHVGAALAGPQGGKVVGGSGSIARPNATTTVIRQQSTNLAIDWQKFNVKPNELVQFKQPGRNAQALNRIFDQNASQIHGQLKANGRVLLMNPNGVIFGRTAKVNVNSLVAAGMRNIPVEDFMAGKFRLEALDGADGVVINEGTIEAAAGGDVTFVGQSIRNDGVIIASAGRVNLAAGNKVTLDFDGDGLMRFAVDEAVLENTQALDAQIENTGTLAAEGGDVIMAASAAAAVFDQAINNAGVIKAGRIDNSGGQIRLVGLGPTASVINIGTLDASARDSGSSGGAIEITGAKIRQAGFVQADAVDGAGGTVTLEAGDTAELAGTGTISARGATGGRVHVLGDKVGLLGDSTIDVSGVNGGGEVLLGGDYQGKNPAIRNARATYISA